MDISGLQLTEYTFEFEASFEQIVEYITFTVRFDNLTKNEVQPNKAEQGESESDEEVISELPVIE